MHILTSYGARATVFAAVAAATVIGSMGCKPRPTAAAADAEAPVAKPVASTKPNLPPEPAPPVARLASEVPTLEAALAKDTAYQGIWTAPRADLNLYLSYVSELLGSNAASSDFTEPLQAKKLKDSGTKLFLIFARLGKFPDDFTQKFGAELDARKGEPNLGTCSTYKAGGPIHDFTVLAAWFRQEDPTYLRQLIAAKSTTGPSPWSALSTTYPPMRLWLASEPAALDRLALYGPLTPEESARVAAIKADASQPKLGQDFQLGDFTYNIASVTAADDVGSGYGKKTASEGARFLIVKYSIRNDGDKTEVVASDDFRIVDPKGRQFQPSTEALTALAMSGGNKDLLLSQLQPGIKKVTATAFELPEAVADGVVTLVIPEKGLLGTKSVRIKLK